MKRSIAVVAMLVVGFAATTCAQTGREIAQKVKDRPDGDTRRSEMVMTLINKRGAVRERKLISYSIDVGKEKKDRILSQEERRIVSYHEVGHALVSALQKDSEPVQKITIVPRTMGALGYVMQVPEEEKYLNTEKEIRAMLVGFLGGRAAEEIVFDTVTTGASNDIEKATRIARAMVTQYGMSKKFGLM